MRETNLVILRHNGGLCYAADQVGCIESSDYHCYWHLWGTSACHSAGHLHASSTEKGRTLHILNIVVVVT